MNNNLLPCVFKIGGGGEMLELAVLHGHLVQGGSVQLVQGKNQVQLDQEVDQARIGQEDRMGHQKDQGEINYCHLLILGNIYLKHGFGLNS